MSGGWYFGCRSLRVIPWMRRLATLKIRSFGLSLSSPESTWMTTTTCSRWSKFSHTFLSFRLCMVILAGFRIVPKCCQWPLRVSFNACLVVCLDAIDAWAGQSPRSLSFSWYCLAERRIPASRHFEKKKKDSLCLIYIRFLGKMCRVEFDQKRSQPCRLTSSMTRRHFREISAFSYYIYLISMDECHYPGSVEEWHIQRGAMKPTTTNKTRTNSTRQGKGQKKETLHRSGDGYRWLWLVWLLAYADENWTLTGLFLFPAAIQRR